jgi:hypothetical protein
MHPFTNTPHEYLNFRSSHFQFITALKGFIKRENFEFIFESMIVDEIEKRRREIAETNSKRALLISDGHPSRCSAKVMKLAKNHHIDIFILPPHLTHILQPLDCGINRDFKFNLGSHISSEERFETSEQREAFMKALCSTIDNTLTMGKILNAWEKSVLSPFNPAVILTGQRIFAPKNTAQTSRGISMVC